MTDKKTQNSLSQGRKNKFKKKVVDLQLQNKGPLQLDCKSLKKQGTDVVIAETRTPPKECLKSIANEEKDKANVAI